MTNIAGFFRRILRIEPGEERKIMLFALLGAMLHGGLAIGMSAVDAIFLSEAGPSFLPIIYVLTPVVMLIYIPIFSYLFARFGVDRVFDLTLGILVTGGLVLFYLFSGPAGGGTRSLVLLCCVKLYANMWLFALYTIYWTFTDGYFDILDAKRLFALFSGGSAFGAMIGGALVSTLIAYIPVANLFLVWTCLALLTAPLLWYVRRIFKRIEEDVTLDETTIGFAEQMRRMATTLYRSGFVRTLTIIVFVTLSITLVCEYQYMTIFTDAARTQATATLGARTDTQVDTTQPDQGKNREIESLSAQNLASLFGKLGAAANAFILIVNLFLFNRLISWLGVRNVTLIQPLIYIGAFTFFLLDYSVSAALVGFFAYQGVMIAVEQNNQNFLFNAMPVEVRKQMRTFIEGIAEPLAVALAGMFLLFYGRDVGGGSVDRVLGWLMDASRANEFKSWLGIGKLTETGISVIGLCGSVAVLLLVFILRWEYLQAMVVNLKRGWLDFSGATLKRLSQLQQPERIKLIDLTRSTDSREALKAIRLLAMNDRPAAMATWLDFWNRASADDRREAQSILVDLLRSGDATSILRILQHIQNEDFEPIPELMEELGRQGLIASNRVASWLNDRAPEKRGAAAVTLWNSWRFDQSATSLQIILGLLQGHPNERSAAIRALGLTRQERYAHFLAGYLADPSDAVRRETLLAILNLATSESVRLIPRILDVVAGGDSESRALGMRILEKIGDSSSILPLLTAAQSFSPEEKRAAESLIVGIGLQSVPAVVAALQQNTLPYRGRSIAARVLSRLAFPQFEALAPSVIEDEILHAYEFVSFQTALGQAERRTPGQNLLLRFYRDTQITIVDFVLELLTLGGRLPSFELLSASLRSSNPKERADAVETIEQGCDRRLFHLLFPLITSHRTDLRTRMAKRLGFSCRLPVETIVARSVESPLPLENAAALQALWETGDSRAPELSRQILLKTGDSFVKKNALLLLEKKAGSAALTDIEKVGLFFASGFFDIFSVLEMADSVASAEEKNFAKGEWIYREGSPCEFLYLNVSGSIEVIRANRTVLVPAGEVFGQEGLLNDAVRKESARSGGAAVLRAPTRTIRRAAHVYPKAALGLLSQTAKGDHRA